MKKLATIIEENLDPQSINLKTRDTVRGVILDGDEVLLIFSKMFNDYTFPGGGCKANEDKMDALRRELKEEVGIDDFRVIDELGYVEEYKYGLNNQDMSYGYHQVSYFYLIEVIKSSEAAPLEREMIQGNEPVMIRIKDAIEHNQLVMRDENHSVLGMKTVLQREIKVLEVLDENASI